MSTPEAAGDVTPAGELIVVSGPPGAGKSTISALLAEHFDPSVLVAGDEFFGFLCTGRIEPWLPESDRQNTTVIAAAAASCGQFVQGGYTVVYDGVVGPWFIEHFLHGTGLGRLHYALLMPGEDKCVDRVRTRDAHPFADVDATRHMYGQFAWSPVAAGHLIGDGEPGELAETIRAAVRRGELLYPSAG